MTTILSILLFSDVATLLPTANPSADTTNVFPVAQDKPNRLALLQGTVNPADVSGHFNVQILMQDFPTVISALTNIQNSANNVDIVRANVAVIHSIRYAKISAPTEKGTTVSWAT